MCTVLYCLYNACTLVYTEHTILHVCESADGTPRSALFLSGSGNPQLQENNPALGLCCDTAHCPCCCVCVCVCVLFVYTCVLLLAGINSVGRVPASDYVIDDGCTRTSSAPPSLSAAAAAVEQGISACSCIHAQPWATAAAQDPPPG